MTTLVMQSGFLVVRTAPTLGRHSLAAENWAHGTGVLGCTREQHACRAALARCILREFFDICFATVAGVAQRDRVSVRVFDQFRRRALSEGQRSRQSAGTCRTKDKGSTLTVHRINLLDV